MASGDLHEEVTPIIITKKRVVGGAHGGAWKVAYADFVTAMMAFFLLLWLLNATTNEQRSGIASYFSPASASLERSGAGAPASGLDITSPGSLTGTGSPTVVSVPLPNPNAEPTSENFEGSTGKGLPGKAPINDETLAKALAIKEKTRFEEAKKRLQAVIAADPALAGFTDNLLIDETPEGLRIQILDRDGRSMFPSGSDAPYDQTVEMLKQITGIVKDLPNAIEIRGHTDSDPFVAPDGSGNWELSARRANAVRRVMMQSGLAETRIAEVAGMADTDPLDKANPLSPINRRVSLILRTQNPNAPLTADQGAAPAGDMSPATTPETAPAPATVP
jgi:chemotaxis protein MotB